MATRISTQHEIARLVAHDADRLSGFTVRAVDGEAGTVASSQELTDDQHLVVHVDTLFGLVGRDVRIETDAIREIDLDAQTVAIDRISDWVKESPRV